MNYIDEIASAIYAQTEGLGAFWTATEDDRMLWRLYAVLCLVAGQATTYEDVHDAWAAWRAGTQPDHRSLIPFEDLAPEVRDLDAPYRDAIRAVARALATGGCVCGAHVWVRWEVREDDICARCGICASEADLGEVVRPAAPAGEEM